jgi:hypothetical protein
VAQAPGELVLRVRLTAILHQIVLAR